ncbi:Uncharacterized protein GBIM_00665 [Gryllus bimaculatus]|nr:Uncharacterized protein GBIM_00665 [Gryllus bimaculatus]
MAMFEEKIIKKVPGNVYPSPKEKQGYIENLNSKTKVELLELLERQDKLLSNKSFIKKLPDQGNRIKTFRERVLKALAEKDQIDQTCGLLSGLSLSKSNVVDEIEWTGELTGVLNESSDISSDEDINPLKILASHSGTGRLKKKIHSSSDEDLHICAVSWKKVLDTIGKDGFREGVSAGHEKTYQDAFDLGYKQGHSLGRRFGFLKGALDVLKMYDSNFSTFTEDSFRVDKLHKTCISCGVEKEIKKFNQLHSKTEDENPLKNNDSFSGNDLAGSSDNFNSSQKCNGNMSADHMRLKEQVKLETNRDTSLISVPEEDSNEENLETSIKSSKEDTTEVKPCNDLYAKHLCEKVDKPPCKKSEPFKPHSTTKSGVHPGLFVPKHQGPHWEVTAATPPPPVHGAVKLITLEESLRIQQLQAAKLKTIQAKHASEKLAINSFVKLGSILPDLSARTEYRDTQQEYDSCHSSDAEENEGQSDEDDKRDTIVYTYTE